MEIMVPESESREAYPISDIEAIILKINQGQKNINDLPPDLRRQIFRYCAKDLK